MKCVSVRRHLRLAYRPASKDQATRRSRALFYFRCWRSLFFLIFPFSFLGSMCECVLETVCIYVLLFGISTKVGYVVSECSWLCAILLQPQLTLCQVRPRSLSCFCQSFLHFLLAFDGSVVQDRTSLPFFHVPEHRDEEKEADHCRKASLQHSSVPAELADRIRGQRPFYHLSSAVAVLLLTSHASFSLHIQVPTMVVSL